MGYRLFHSMKDSTEVKSSPKCLGDVQQLANSFVFVDDAEPCQLAEECHPIQCRWPTDQRFVNVEGIVAGRVFQAR